MTESGGLDLIKKEAEFFDASLVYKKAKDILETHADKFAFSSGENDYYSGMIDLVGLIKTPKSDYLLILGFNKERNVEKDATEMILLQRSSGKTVYRLDIKSGPETEAEMAEMDKRLSEIKLPESDLAKVRHFLKTKHAKLDGVLTSFESNWAETSITDKEAFEIISSTTDVEVPQNMQHLPTWDKVKTQKKKLRVPRKLLK